MAISQVKTIQLTDAQLTKIHVLLLDRAYQLRERFLDPSVSLIELDELDAELAMVTSIVETVAQA